MPEEKDSEAEGDGLIELGGNIELRGFSKIDRANMVIVKKIVGNYARKFSDTLEKFESLVMTIKTVHEREKSEKYELQTKVLATGKVFNAQVTDRNLFFAIDSALKKVSSEIR